MKKLPYSNTGEILTDFELCVYLKTNGWNMPTESFWIIKNGKPSLQHGPSENHNQYNEKYSSPSIIDTLSWLGSLNTTEKNELFDSFLFTDNF